MAGQSERAAQLGDFSELAYINYDYYIFNSSEYENGTHTHTHVFVAHMANYVNDIKSEQNIKLRLR